MHFHSQNLNDKRGGLTGSKWRAGRCWLHFGKDSRHCIGFEWSCWRRNLNIGMGLGEGDHAISFHFGIGLVNLYLHLDHDKTMPNSELILKDAAGKLLARVVNLAIPMMWWQDPMVIPG